MGVWWFLDGSVSVLGGGRGAEEHRGVSVPHQRSGSPQAARHLQEVREPPSLRLSGYSASYTLVLLISPSRTGTCVLLSSPPPLSSPMYTLSSPPPLLLPSILLCMLSSPLLLSPPRSSPLLLSLFPPPHCIETHHSHCIKSPSL